MLKIKDDVDLKELEKFGFEAEECPNGVIRYRKTIYEDDDLAYFYLDIYDCDREFDSIWGTGHKNFIDIEFLFDLIQAGLVEKVEE